MKKIMLLHAGLLMSVIMHNDIECSSNQEKMFKNKGGHGMQPNKPKSPPSKYSPKGNNKPKLPSNKTVNNQDTPTSDANDMSQVGDVDMSMQAMPDLTDVQMQSALDDIANQNQDLVQNGVFQKLVMHAKQNPVTSALEASSIIASGGGLIYLIYKSVQKYKSQAKEKKSVTSAVSDAAKTIYSEMKNAPKRLKSNIQETWKKWTNLALSDNKDYQHVVGYKGQLGDYSKLVDNLTEAEQMLEDATEKEVGVTNGYQDQAAKDKAIKDAQKKVNTISSEIKKFQKQYKDLKGEGVTKKLDALEKKYQKYHNKYTDTNVKTAKGLDQDNDINAIRDLKAQFAIKGGSETKHKKFSTELLKK